MRKSGLMVTVLAVTLLALSSSLLLAQATGTLTGTVLDQDSLVLPGATIVVRNTQTGDTRQTVTTGTGTYTVPALIPGPYEVRAELPGFDPVVGGANVVTASTVSVDLQMGIASLEETVTVSAAAPLVEVTQAVVASSIRQQEVRELPMINRSLAAMMTLLPGAREVEARGSHGHASNYVSFAGNTGRSYNMYVDGIDNKEDQDGGTLLQYSLDGIEEFRALGAGFKAEYGRGSTVVTLATKSGTNQFTGTGFVQGRNESMTATDFFSHPDNGGLGKAPFKRTQYGGSFGGPIVENRAWFFASIERIVQDYNLPRDARSIEELTYLQTIVPDIHVGGIVPQPFRDLLFQVRGDFRINENQTGFLKVASQYGFVDNPRNNASVALWKGSVFAERNDQDLYAAVGGWTWVPNSQSVNELRAQFQYYLHTDISGAQCTLEWNDCVQRVLRFPSVNNRRPGFAHPSWVNYETKVEIVNNFSRQMGRHYVKVGFDYARLPTFYANLQTGPGYLRFFHDPSVILNNTNGLYPQGIQTPGAVRQILVASQYQVDAWSDNAWHFAGYLQDDYQMTPKLTLNLGLRYDINELMNNCCWERNRAGRILRAIDHPLGGIPVTDSNNWGPRLGVAYDVSGDGTDVVRGSFGLYYATGIITSAYSQNQLEQDVVVVYNTVSNSSVGQGPLGDWVYGVDSVPEVPAAPTEFLPGQNSRGRWYHPDFADAYSYNSSLGWSHLFTPRTVFSVDYLNVAVRNGWRRLPVNPLVDHDNDPVTSRIRALAPDLESVYGDPALLGPVDILCSCNEGRYDGVDLHFEHRFVTGSAFQVNYTLAWARGMGGSTDFTTQGAYNGPERHDVLGTGIYDDYERGPTAYDERHRVTVTGVFPLPGGFTVSPLVTVASARPYTQYSANGRYGVGDRLYLRDASGLPLGPYNARGKALINANARVTKTFELPRGQQASLFLEFYNLLNRSNFGNNYGANAFSPRTYNQPNGYLGGIGSTSTLPISFQVQIGVRYEF